MLTRPGRAKDGSVCTQESPQSVEAFFCLGIKKKNCISKVCFMLFSLFIELIQSRFIKQPDTRYWTSDAPHPVALQVSHLDLKQGQVSQDLQVVLVPLQSIAVTLDGLIILLIRALQQAINMPAWDTQGVKEHTHTVHIVNTFSQTSTVELILKVWSDIFSGVNMSSVLVVRSHTFLFIYFFILSTCRPTKSKRKYSCTLSTLVIDNGFMKKPMFWYM